MQHTKTTVIFFLGGCTFTEVSAIRFLAQHDESKLFSFILHFSNQIMQRDTINGTNFCHGD